MVQILPGKKPGAVSQLISGALGAAPEALNALTTELEKNKIMDARKSYYKDLGLDEDVAFQPEAIQKMAVEKALKGPSVWEKFQGKDMDAFQAFESMTPEDRAGVKKESPELFSVLNERRKEQEKAGQPAKTPLREKPIEPEQLKKIQDVRSQPGFEGLSAKEQYRAFIDAGISPVNAEREAKFREEEAKITAKEKTEFHKESKEYADGVSKEARQAHTKLRSIDKQRELAPKLTTQDRFISAVFGGTKLENLLKSQNAQEFDALVLPQIEGMRDIFGVRLSDADLRLVLQKIATSDKNPEANLTILDFYELEPKLALERSNIAKEIIKENNGYRPPNFENMVEDRINERFGDEIQEKFNKVMGLKSDEDRKAQLTGRSEVTPGTVMDEKTGNRYLKLAKGDPDLATKMAEEDGYVIPE